MATEAKIIEGVRLELGDSVVPFRASFRGDGVQDDFDLPAQNVVDTSVTAYQINEDNTITALTGYTLDSRVGMITFDDPPDVDARVIVEGTSFGIFSDDEVRHFVEAATYQHLANRTVQTRFRDGHGFIKYDRRSMELADLPVEEEVLVTILATVESLWALATDAATDIDVQTSEGTNIPRGQRWRQLVAQIDILTDKYREVSGMLGVGLFAPEVLTMRRVSRQTNRLVPVFQEREYDEHGPPIRKLPPRSDRDVDEDGPASPFWTGGYGF